MSAPVFVRILGETWELPDSAWAEAWRRCRATSTGSRARRMAADGSAHSWTSRVTVASIEARAGEWLMFHAAGVSTTEGRVVALIGPSGTGKSTAAQTLCANDLGYVTDETVAVDASGDVVPFPKPIAVESPDASGKVQVGPDDLGLLPCPSRLTLRGMAVLERNARYTTPELEILPPFDGLIAVIPEISALPHLAEPLRSLTQAAEICGGVHRIRYADAGDLVASVHAILAADPVAYHARHHPAIELPNEQRDAVGAVGPANRILRAAFTDALELGGEVLLLQGPSCVRLGGVGALAWLAVALPRTPEELLAEVIAAAGDHPDAAELLSAAVAELESLGVLIRV